MILSQLKIREGQATCGGLYGNDLGLEGGSDGGGDGLGVVYSDCAYGDEG